MKNWLNIGCLGLLMGWMVACSNEQIPDPQQDKASLTLEVATSAASRAVAPGDGDLYKGGGMEDLTVVLVNSSNVIVAKKQVTGLTGEEQKTKVVTIDEGLDVGNYTLYAFANTENALLGEAKTLLNGLSIGGVWNHTDALFVALTGTDVPTMDNTHPLLLTASKNVPLGINDNHTTIDLLRPIVWFQVKLYNHSEKDMTVSALSFSDFNPSTGFLLPHDGNVPSSVSYRSLPAYGGGVTVEAGTNEVVYDIALFENVADSYTMNMTLQTEGTEMTNTATLNTNTQYALKNRSTGRYLVDNGGTLGVATYTGVVPEEALWRFSGTTGSGYITNVKTGNKFYRSTKAETSVDNLTFGINSNYLRIFYNQWWQDYFLRDNNGSVNFSTGNAQTRDWQLQTTNAANITNAQLMTINSETAAVEPLTRQIRNQHITVTVNAYYNEEEGTFKFEVEPWKKKEAGVTFN